MGYTVDFKGWNLVTKSNEDADKAVAAMEEIHEKHGTDYHIQVEASHASVEGEVPFLDVIHCQGDHWSDDEMKLLWLAMAPFMADGAEMILEGEGGDRWRVSWQGGKVFEQWEESINWGPRTEVAPEREEAS